MPICLPYKITDDLEENRLTLKLQIGSLFGENSVIKELRSKGLIDKDNDSILSKKYIENDKAIQELHLIQAALTPPPYYVDPPRYLFSVKLKDAQSLCDQIHQKSLEFFKCLDAAKNLDESEKGNDHLIQTPIDAKSSALELVKQLQSLCYPPRDENYKTSSDIISERNKEIRILTEQLSQAQREASSAHNASTLIGIFFLITLILGSFAGASRQFYKEELEELQEEYSDYEYSTEENMWETSEQYIDLLTQYDDLKRYSEFLESEIQHLEESLEDAEDVLDELESRGAFERYDVYY